MSSVFVEKYKPVIEQRIEQSVSMTTKVVFPNNINHHLTLFGGVAMAWMDEISFITATRFCRKTLVTVSTERINFKKPIPSGTIVQLTGKVSRVGNTSLTVDITIDVEQMHEDQRHQVIAGQFNFVAVDDDGHPVPLFDEAFLIEAMKHLPA
ncbi:acyl-CoA thioesterase [Celerinatantimonas sp. YJH-8]|uniref:acyl-CoA thioesterase n=1 Tax=Celerinatantimonas sp. YJH-8 TaxID=3228714 RepID=UPI0038C86581